jgi:hypothetical protein
MIAERYPLHRYKATSHAAAVGAVLLVGFFLYDCLARDVLRWDPFIVASGVQGLSGPRARRG